MSAEAAYPGLAFRLAVPSDAPAMQRVIRGIVERLPDPGWFALLSDEEMSTLTGEEGFSFLVVPASAAGQAECAREDNAEHAILAMVCIRTDGLDASYKHLLADHGYPEDLTALLDVVAVQEGQRGLGLQRSLIQLAENALWARGFLALTATVHPANHFSLRNFEQAGFQILQEVTMYGGKPRYLIGKRL